MEKKNMVLLTVIAVATLLVAVVGATFAYFTASITNEYNKEGNGTADISSGTVGSSTTTVANIEGQAGQFTATDVYPGHKEVAALSVKVEGGSQSVDIIYTPTNNDFPANSIKMRVYRATGTENIGDGKNIFSCEKVTGTTGSEQTFYEDCREEEETELLGNQVGSEVTLTGADQNGQKIVLAQDTINNTTNTYYVVVEFVDTGAEQNSAQGKTLNGDISVQLTP